MIRWEDLIAELNAVNICACFKCKYYEWCIISENDGYARPADACCMIIAHHDIAT